MKYGFGVALASALVASAKAHSWIEQMMVVAPNGTMIGDPGFARGNVKRSSPIFGDPTMVNLIPPNGRTINTILDTDLLCKSSQTTRNQTDGSPRLKAAAGANVALRYQENGHVSLPQNQAGKPPNRGTVYVYGTTQPLDDDKFLSIHRVWNAAGTGGDKRGVLLSTQNFDDGQCYQVNSGDISQARQKQFAHTSDPLTGGDLWCQQDVQIPSTAPSGQPYTLYWVWDWPTLPGTTGFPQGKQEIYTTCMDVDITVGAPSQVVTNNFIVGQDLNRAAISSEIANIANPTLVTGSAIPFSGQATASATASGSSSGSPSSSASSLSTSVSSASSTVTVTVSQTFLSTFSVTTPASTFSSFLTLSTPSVTVVTVTNMQTVTQPVTTVTATLSASSASTDPVVVSSGRPPVQPVFSFGGQQQQSGASWWRPQQTGGNWNVNGWNNYRPPGGSGGAAQDEIVTSSEVVTVTDIATTMETVYQTVFAASKRAEPTTAVSAQGTPSNTSPPCSKTASAYRLRARNPLFLFHL